MSQEIWINLPVKDVERSTAFFNEIGFHAVSVGNKSQACHRPNNDSAVPG